MKKQMQSTNEILNEEFEGDKAKSKQNQFEIAIVSNVIDKK